MPPRDQIVSRIEVRHQPAPPGGPQNLLRHQVTAAARKLKATDGLRPRRHQGPGVPVLPILPPARFIAMRYRAALDRGLALVGLGL